MAPARCSVSKLLHHALRSIRAPLHENLGRRMAGVLSRIWNSERPLVFVQVVITKTLRIRRAKDIRAQIIRIMYLWERGLPASLVGDSEAKGDA